MSVKICSLNLLGAKVTVIINAVPSGRGLPLHSGSLTPALALIALVERTIFASGDCVRASLSLKM